MLLWLIAPTAHTNEWDKTQRSLFETETPLLPAAAAFVFSSRQQNHQLYLTWEMQPGYYLYRNQFKFQANGVKLLEQDFPEPKQHHDAYFGMQPIYRGSFTIVLNLADFQPKAALTIDYLGCAENRLCYPPMLQTVTIEPFSNKLSNIQTSALPEQTRDLTHLLQSDNMLWSLLLFFVLGLGLSFTPCVFPMYPILSSILVNQQDKSTRGGVLIALSYVQGMAITYSLLGLVVALAGLQYQSMFQHPVILLVLAALFVILSLAMFDLYQLQLPSAWQQQLAKLTQQQTQGKLARTFIVGAISGLIASPCTTAPLSGALLYIAQSGDVLFGFLALYCLSIGMGVPLILIGLGGGKWLPKAGAWMHIIKAVFGWLLLAVAITLIARLSSDLIVTGLWLSWSIGVLTWLCWRYFKRNTAPRTLPKTSLIVIITLLTCGFWFQQIAHLWRQQNEAHAPHRPFIEINSLTELQTQLQRAQQNQQTVLVDIFALWCVACRELEQKTFPAPEVQARFKDMLLLRLNVTEINETNSEILEQYAITGMPTLLLFTKTGQEAPELRITGFVDAEHMVTTLDKLQDMD